MKKYFFFAVLLVLCYHVNFAQVSSTDMQHMDSSHKMINNNDIQWMDGPPGLPAGAKVSVLNGDPSKEGMFTLRAMLPANYKVPPHWHPSTENVTVVDGTLYMGSGEKIDEKKATMLNPGGFSSIPANSPHYVFTKKKCVIQVHAMGPFAITYINSADDPRNK